jgi:murein L,D-transpeptidase YcbB/YkuD
MFSVPAVLWLDRYRASLLAGRGGIGGLWLIGLGLLPSWPVLADVDPWGGLPAALQVTGAVPQEFSADVARFYAERQYRPLWFNGVQPGAKAAALLAVLGQAEAEGLNPADYAPAALRQACGADLLACELRLTDSLLRYTRDVAYGALRAVDTDPNWHIPQRMLPAAELLDQVAASSDLAALLQQLPPSHAAYRQLRTALAERRQTAAIRGFALPAGPSLRPGDRDDRVMALRERLGADRPALLGSADAAYFDAPLAAAVVAFQARHGLDEDGIVGTRTLAALNVTPEERIAQIRLNMERWRWLPRDLGDSHILVNLAGFDLTLVQAGEPTLRLRAISGRPDRTSPAFASRINRLVINPDWTVPRRLAVEDMLPQLQRDPLALQAKGIVILRRQDGVLVEVDPAGIDWRSYHKNNFPFVLQQLPGPHNSLGLIKFAMPNPFDIYIHDTPAKALFSKKIRTLSSGCIRVDQSLQLASRLLGDNPDAAMHTLQEAIERGETTSLPVSPQLPVYLVYLTAWVDEQGNLQFRNDVYGRDLQMRDRFAFP